MKRESLGTSALLELFPVIRVKSFFLLETDVWCMIMLSKLLAPKAVTFAHEFRGFWGGLNDSHYGAVSASVMASATCAQVSHR